MWHFLFNAEPGSRRAERCAALLCAGLARQGVSCERHNERVSAQLTSAEGADQYVYIVMDEGALESPVLRGLLDRDSILLVNSPRSAEGILGLLSGSLGTLAAVNAERLADEEGAEVESALLGGLARAVPWVDAEAIASAVWMGEDSGFGYRARSAVRAFDQGLAQAQVAQRSPHRL